MHRASRAVPYRRMGGTSAHAQHGHVVRGVVMLVVDTSATVSGASEAASTNDTCAAALIPSVSGDARSGRDA